MQTVNVKKDELLTKVRSNRDKHRGIFEEALDGYQKRCIELLEEHLDRVRRGTRERVVVSIPFPEDHTDDYDVVIAQLEMSVDDEIEVFEQEFRQYVMDQWSWSRSFYATNSVYSATAAASV